MNNIPMVLPPKDAIDVIVIDIKTGDIHKRKRKGNHIYIHVKSINKYIAIKINKLELSGVYILNAENQNIIYKEAVKEKNKVIEEFIKIQKRLSNKNDILKKIKDILYHYDNQNIERIDEC